jgi:hypothetical protein
MKHFGVVVRSKKYGLKVTRENYVNISSKSSFRTGYVYTKEYCASHAIWSLINYDLNMSYFDALDKKEFDQEITNFLKLNTGFDQITDLQRFEGSRGYYLLVLDEYKQAYVGTSSNIAKRIKEHWNKHVRFDRLIFGGVDNSILSIDSFRALDTTRIYVSLDNSGYEEAQLIECIPKKFDCNRTIGGILDKGLIEAIEFRKTRNLISNLKDFSISISYEDEINPRAVHLHEVFMHLYQEKLEIKNLRAHDNTLSFVGKYASYKINVDLMREKATIYELLDSYIGVDKRSKEQKRRDYQRDYREISKPIINKRKSKRYHILKGIGYSTLKATQMSGWSMGKVITAMKKDGKDKLINTVLQEWNQI